MGFLKKIFGKKTDWKEEIRKIEEEEKEKEEKKEVAGRTEIEEKPFSFKDMESAAALFQRLLGDVEVKVGRTIATIEKGQGDFVAPSEVREQLKRLKDLAQAAKEGVLRKISEQLGSNEGGWYEDQETGKRYYIKFYKNPEQARIEFVANAIYEKLGINVVRSQLIEMGGKLAIASEAIPGAESAALESQKGSEDVRRGFIADAYLANWDVVGLVFDNIIKDKNGRMYRIDNGGSLTFRAQGQTKDFPPDRIDELESMLKPDYPAGQVFAGLSKEEMRRQAQELVSKLKEEDIDTILKESGLAGPLRKKIRDGLLGRREFLIKHFDLRTEETAAEKVIEPAKRIPLVIEELERRRESFDGKEMRPRVGFLADSDRIEGQQIDVIDAPDRGYVEINFKFTEKQMRRIAEKIKKMQEEGLARDGLLAYDSVGDQRFDMVDAWEIEQEGITIRISKGTKRRGDEIKEMRSSLGLVDIRISKEGKEIDVDKIGRRINALFVDLFEVPEGLSIPPAEAERAYKLARYAWHHKLNAGDPTVDWAKVEEKLVRKEVAAGYYTMIEPGKHREYEDKHSPCTVFHSIGDLGVIPKILRVGGLFSTHERYRRGLLLNGWSSEKDLEKGGGDSVFTRLLSEAGIKASRDQKLQEFMGASAFLIFNPRVLDRTDWYAYEQDRYGSTDPVDFKERLSPEEFFEKQKKWTSRSFGCSENEVMFRLGISIQDVEVIACPYDPEEGWQAKVRAGLKELGIEKINGLSVEELISRGAEVTRVTLEKAGISSLGGRPIVLVIGEGDARDRILKILRSQGIDEINGKPIEQFVVYAQTTSDLVDLSHGREARSMRKPKVLEEEAFTIEAAA